MRLIGFITILCLFITNATAQCEIRINNLTAQPALAKIQYEYGLTDEVSINPHRSLFVDLYYNNYCHSHAYFRLYRNLSELYFSGPLISNQVFDIQN